MTSAGAVEQVRHQRLDRAGIARRVMRRGARQRLARAKQGHPHRPAFARKLARRDEAVAAIVAGTAQHGNRPLRPARRHRLGHGAARRFHERVLADAAGHRGLSAALISSGVSSALSKGNIAAQSVDTTIASV